MNKKQLKEQLLITLFFLEDDLNVLTCLCFSNRKIRNDYRKFLKEQQILNNPNKESIDSKYFRDLTVSNLFLVKNEQANIFRMMVITEFAKQKGIRL